MWTWISRWGWWCAAFIVIAFAVRDGVNDDIDGVSKRGVIAMLMIVCALRQRQLIDMIDVRDALRRRLNRLREFEQHVDACERKTGTRCTLVGCPRWARDVPMPNPPERRLS